MKKCFIVSPIGSEGTDIRKRADQVYKYIISPVCETCGFEPIRVDQINQSDSITETIIDLLKKSELVIADMTGHNPNAFYEMGFRACTGKPMIHLKEKGEIIPFDIASIRAFDFDLTDLDAVAEVKSRLEQTIKSMDFSENETVEVPGTNQNSDSPVSSLLPVLYDIQDQIKLLRDEIHGKDTETIQAIVRAIPPAAPAEDPNATVLKALIPEMLKNPKSFQALLEISDRVNKNKDQSK